ncbi:MAG: cytochrome c peroxidase [Methylococcaceae bacterium]
MNLLNRYKILLLLLGGLSSIHAEAKPLAMGYGALPFDAASAGSYQLPVLGNAANGRVLTSDNKPINLYDLMGNKIVLLSFIYSTCSDVNGCPLATAVLHKIHYRLKQNPQLASQLRLLTLSFNPQQDTPQVMQHYAQEFKGGAVDWQFLTTQSEKELQPILHDYAQTVQKVFDEKGQFTGTFSHNLRVYLIDKNKQLRNIYSVDFLHPDTLINDIETLLIKPTASINNTTIKTAELYNAGDNKSNYDSANYQTHSVALSDRIGKTTDLLKTIKKPPLGLPKVPVPKDNPITSEKINLGKKLFYDRRLSLNHTFSCAMCHIPEQGFTNNEMATAVGIEGRTVKRNSPTLYNISYASALFHDSRETTLEQQVWSPLLAHNEMANPSIGFVINTINNSNNYPQLFLKAFGKPASMETIGQAIASYERSLNSGNSAFDRWYYGKDNKALNENAGRGFELFIGKANCVQCHSINKQNALFTDNQTHNTGMGYAEAMILPKLPKALNQKIQVAAGVFVDVDAKLIQSVAEIKENDLGRYEVTQNPQDRWQYKTPSLRNISLTAPYMHNGRLQTLKQVVAFYNDGGIANEGLDTKIKPLLLSAQEINDLVAFLESLTGDNVQELVSDAFSAPIGEIK